MYKIDRRDGYKLQCICVYVRMKYVPMTVFVAFEKKMGCLGSSTGADDEVDDAF